MYDEDTRERVLMLLELGFSPTRISRMLGGRPGRSTIEKWQRGVVPTGKRRKSCALTCEEKVRAVRRVQAGEDYRSVAEEVGCVPATLLTWRQKLEANGETALRTRLDDYLDKR